jgi:ATP-binding cassette, subfamily F, member 3
VVFVSHYRYFIDKLATRIFEIEDGAVRVYPGNYEDYLWRKSGGGAGPLGQPLPAEPEGAPAASSANQSPASKAERRLNPIKLRQMRERQLEIEEEVTKLEAEIAECEAALGSFVSVDETRRLSELLEARRGDLASLLSEWEEVSETLNANA